MKTEPTESAANVERRAGPAAPTPGTGAPAGGPGTAAPIRPGGGGRDAIAGGRRRPWFTIIATVAAVGLAIALAAVLVTDDGDDVTTGEAPGVTEPADEPAPSTAPGTDDGTAETTAPAAETIQLTVYFLDADLELVPVERLVPQTRAVARAAMTELLDGPEASDPGGITTAIPVHTRLHDIAIADGVATVDLSRHFTFGGGSASMRGRVAQVVYTLTEFETVSAVRFLVEGEPVEALGGEGLLLDEPQTRADWADL